MESWTAFLLGFAGSAHCAGMCGPLALALPMQAEGRAMLMASRLLYNAGRLFTYACLGAGFGLLGQGLAIAGLQRWVSLVLGALLLLGLCGSTRLSHTGSLIRAVDGLKSALGTLLRRHSLTAFLGIGLLNGLLPCGLVYAAGAGAATAGDGGAGARYMLVFGCGTVPMMLALSLAGPKVQFALRCKLQRLVPVSIAIVGALLVLRGLSLDIPYLSPRLPAQGGLPGTCH